MQAVVVAWAGPCAHQAPHVQREIAGSPVADLVLRALLGVDNVPCVPDSVPGPRKPKYRVRLLHLTLQQRGSTYAKSGSRGVGPVSVMKSARPFHQPPRSSPRRNTYVSPATSFLRRHAVSEQSKRESKTKS